MKDTVTRRMSANRWRRMSANRWRGAAAAAVIAMAAVGCGPQFPDDGRPRAAVVLMQEDQFFRLCEYGMRAAAEDEDINVMVTSSRNDLNQEISLVDTHIANQVDALIVAPLSISGSIPALESAYNQDIHIVTYDTFIDAAFPVASIQSDQTALGRSTGEVVREYIENELSGEARVAIIQYIALAPEPGGMRVEGFEGALEGLDGVEIVARQDAWLAPEATNVAENLLTAHPDLDIIWAANEGGTVGAATAVRNTGRAGDVRVFGTDMSGQIGEFLLADDAILHAVTGQRPYDIGRLAMESAAAAIRGEEVEGEVLLPGELFTRDEPDAIREYLDFIDEVTR